VKVSKRKRKQIKLPLQQLPQQPSENENQTRAHQHLLQLRMVTLMQVLKKVKGKPEELWVEQALELKTLCV
jgi:hypothetical protein